MREENKRWARRTDGTRRNRPGDLYIPLPPPPPPPWAECVTHACLPLAPLFFSGAWTYDQNVGTLCDGSRKPPTRPLMTEFDGTPHRQWDGNPSVSGAEKRECGSADISVSGTQRANWSPNSPTEGQSAVDWGHLMPRISLHSVISPAPDNPGCRPREMCISVGGCANPVEGDHKPQGWSSRSACKFEKAMWWLDRVSGLERREEDFPGCSLLRTERKRWVPSPARKKKYGN